MPNLSTPIGELRPSYGLVVVGSGYGGAIAAYRMATRAQQLRANGEPSFSVYLLERGLEIRPGDYPATFASGLRHTQVDTRFGRVVGTRRSSTSMSTPKSVCSSAADSAARHLSMRTRCWNLVFWGTSGLKRFGRPASIKSSQWRGRRSPLHLYRMTYRSIE